MENTILLQLYSFLIYLISGIIIGILFDIFRILRKSFQTPDFLTYLEDILFWLLTGIFLLFVLFQFSNGEIRIYQVIAILIGNVFYLLSISKFFITINVKILTFIKHVIGNILKVVLTPIKLVITCIKKIIMPLPFFVINIQKTIAKSSQNIKNKKKKKKKQEKMTTERRILKRNVEKYN